MVIANVRSTGLTRNERAETKRPYGGAHLSVEGLSHAYSRSRGLVLQDIDFQVEPGQVIALLGRSGCGKSTLLHMLSGLSLPSAGRVVIDGLTVRATSPRWVMMFQSPSLLPWLSVAGNVAMGLRFTRRATEISARVPEVLELVEMGAYASRRVQELSGGQQQRVALARSLAPKPEMLLLDEPFSALDAFTRRALQMEVRTIARELGLTMVIVSHDVAEVVRMADRTLLLASDPGRISDDMLIDLDENEREGGSGRFSAELRRVMTAYGGIAGEAVGPVLE